MNSFKYSLGFLLLISLCIRGQLPDKVDLEEVQEQLENGEPGEVLKDEENIESEDDKVVSARVVLDSGNFQSIFQTGYTFVKFYAPWCPHCVQIAPDWNDLANYFHKNPIDDVKLIIGDADCTSALGAQLCHQQNVNGYPTVKLYKDGAEIKDYDLDRDFVTMRKFLISEIKGLDIEVNQAGVHALDDFTFKTFLKDAGEETPVVIKFFAPGCPACIAIEKTYNELASRFLDIEMEDVKFAEVNCLDQSSLEICSDEGVEEFPSVYLYKDGQLEDIYGGDRSLQDMVNFVWETVDNTQVEEEDAFGNFANIFEKISLGGNQGGAVEEEEEEEEECVCGEPGCICDEDDEEEEDSEEEEEEEEESEDEQLSDKDGETDETIDGDLKDNTKEETNSETLTNPKHTEL